MSGHDNKEIPVLPVNQWLRGWDSIDFQPDEHRGKPEKRFYMFALPARELRSLSGIARRIAKNATPRTSDLGIQRQHDPERSEEIGRFVEYGYPWSTLTAAKQKSSDYNDLRKPGWLPTAIVLNILTKGSKRNGAAINDADVVSILESEGKFHLRLPYKKWDAEWSPAELPPFEIIDGQHRLWAFDQQSQFQNFELPVVAFVNLDISWQAYLFWTINIKPKRINPSLAFDLYPLLRSEDWLDRAEGHAVYRETRAQELTEIMWSYPDSPWYDRINMLGERLNPWVSQSAWIKSLTASFIRSWEGRAGFTGGLFGGRAKGGEVLGWTRAQQSAFLIFSWRAFKERVEKTQSEWAIHLRQIEAVSTKKDVSDKKPAAGDPAFYGAYTLINTDQGVRGFLHILNDIFYRRASALKLNTWVPDHRSSTNPIDSLESSIESLSRQVFVDLANKIADGLASFDWRTSATPGLSEDIRRPKLAFRGGSGYKELRIQLLEHLSDTQGEVGETANTLRRLS